MNSNSDRMDIDENVLKPDENNQMLAIVTVDVGMTFHNEMTGVLGRVKEIIKKEPDFVTTQPMGCHYIIGTFTKMIRVLLLRLIAGRDAPSPIHPFVGRMHFEYSEGGPLILAAIYEFASVSKASNLEWLRAGKTIQLLDELRQCVDTYPVHRVIVPAVIPGVEIDPPRIPPTDDPLAYDFKEWWGRMCRGIRTPEDLPWAPTCDEIGHIIFIEGLATITTKSMRDEFYARGEDLTPLPFPISGIPKRLEYDYEHCRDKGADGPIAPPRLQHSIRRSELPDVLLVSDPDEVTVYKDYSPDDDLYEQDSGNNEKKPDFVEEISYRRTNPLSIGVTFVHPPPSSGTPRVARLELTKANRLGFGNSAQVYSSTIQFNIPHPASGEIDTEDHPGSSRSDSSEERPVLSRQPEKFTVAAKIPLSRSSRSIFVFNEACIYEQLPEYLSESYDGFYMVPKDITGTRAVPVVPKSYGYYTMDGVDKSGRRHNPILLIEECGEPIATYDSECAQLPLSDRLLLHSMVRRLHRAGFYQGSFSPRNIVMQPGPLHFPPAQRTLDQPSYRIIDFGRGVNQRVYFADKAKLTARDVQMHAIDERRKALDLFDLEAGIYHT